MALFIPYSFQKPRVCPKTTFIISVLIATLSLSACETLPAKPMSQTPTPQQNANLKTSNQKINNQRLTPQNDIITEADYVSEETLSAYPDEPYIISQLPASIEGSIKTAPTSEAPSATTPPVIQPSHNELLERARQNSGLKNNATVSSKSSLPAFQKLMTTGMNELKSGQLTDAENSFTRAQRLNPQSSAVYFYLSQVAIKKNQPRKAEAMARRGLSFTTDNPQRHALWQLILRSGQLQNNTRVIQEAQKALR